MGQKNKKLPCWQSIPLKQRLRLYLGSLLIAIWVLIKYAFEMLWKTEKKKLRTWDRPPSCLVDNALGYHYYVKLQGVKLHYVESGNKHSQLVLLLHGFPDCWLGWRNQIKILSNHYRVVAIDLKGFGDSDKPAWRIRYEIKTILTELYELINYFGSENCIMIGHDLGAHIGWYFVSSYPHIIDKFVAISCPHPNIFWDSIPVSSRFNWRWMQFCQVPFLPEVEARKDNIAIIDALFGHLYGRREDKLKQAYKYVFSQTADWSGPINYYRNLPFYRIRPKVKVDVPTMLLIGNKDPFVPLESIVKSTDYTNKFVMKIVENSGHFPHQDNPNDVNDLLQSFLIVPDPNHVEKTESPKGLIGNLYSNTMKYGNSFVDVVMKTTMLKHSGD